MSIVRSAWRRANRTSRHQLYFLKAVDLTFHPLNTHPNFIEFMMRFGCDKALKSNHDCQWRVHFKEEVETTPEIKVTYENDITETLDYTKPIEVLVTDFKRRRDELQFLHEMAWSLKTEEEENPFTTQDTMGGK